MATTALSNPEHVAARDGWRGVLVELGFVAAALAVNQLVRWYTRDDLDVALANARDVLALQQELHLDWEVAAQDLATSVPGLSTVAAHIYVWAYLPVVLGTMLWLYAFHRPHYRQLRTGLLASGAVGALGYAFYPCAPPRLAGLGYADTVADTSALEAVARPFIANEIAAIPSFHVAWLLLAVLALASTITVRWVRWLLLSLPVVMSFAILTTGNHWVLDIPAGLLVFLVGLVAGRRLSPVRPS